VADVLVVGIGNRLRGDDGAGPAVADRVRERVGPGVLVVEHDGEPASLLDLVSRARVAVLVDAAYSGAPPGTCLRLDATHQRLPATVGGASTHGVGLAEAVELGRALGRLPAALHVVCVEGASYAIGAGLSTAVAAAVDAAADEVLSALGARGAGASRTTSASRAPISGAGT
jgi:hydrogenase maturation protease